jgi:hypothetical protein
VWTLFHQWWEAFLANPQATFSAWIGAGSTVLGIYLQVLKSRNTATVKAMQSEPPSPEMATFHREVTGAHKALVTALDHETRVRRAEWVVDDLREKMAEKEREMAEIVSDASRIGAALSAANERILLAERKLDRVLAEKRALHVAYEAEKAKCATLENAKTDSEARLAQKQRELEACEKRCGAIALELHDRKHEAASMHSVELALSPDPEAVITPLRPPAPPGRPKGSK